MPLRPFSREQAWLLPPSLEELIPLDHPARFVAVFIDSLHSAAWKELGININGEELGAGAYHPKLCAAVWLYGFFAGIRSSRKLETACKEQLPLLWLTANQQPDHNTLWRFYKNHRKGMRKLFKRTVKTAVEMGLVDLTVQALDGTKIAANATRDHSCDKKKLERLLERTDKAIADIEAQNATGGDPVPPRLPAKLAKCKELQAQVKAALQRVQAKEGPKTVNLTDEDAALVKGRLGIIAGYNAQAMVSPLEPAVAQGTGLLITAVDVVADADDHAQLIPMLEEAEANVGQRADVTLADGGYHSGENLEACIADGIDVLLAESKAVDKPYHKDHFAHDAENDCYKCPEGQTLSFVGTKKRKDRPEVRIYRGAVSVCRSCPAFGECTKDKRQGRSLEIGPHEQVLRAHRELKAKPECQELYSRRKELVEPAFGILKELHGARRFLLRGLENVRSEWALLATAFNLRTLWRVWRRQIAVA